MKMQIRISTPWGKHEMNCLVPSRASRRGCSLDSTRCFTSIQSEPRHLEIELLSILLETLSFFRVIVRRLRAIMKRNPGAKKRDR